jgi:hypothetical protein
MGLPLLSMLWRGHHGTTAEHNYYLAAAYQRIRT